MSRVGTILASLIVTLVAVPVACGNDAPPPYYGTPADTIGVGAECKADTDCLQTDAMVQHCLTEFKGGYCGMHGGRRVSERFGVRRVHYDDQLLLPNLYRQVGM